MIRKTMGRLIPLILGLIGVIALVGTVWMLFSTKEDKTTRSDPFHLEEMKDTSLDEQGVFSKIEGASPSESPPQESRVTPDQQAKEKILPEHQRDLYRGKLLVHVVTLEDHLPVEDATLELKLLFNDITLDKPPRIVEGSNLYLFEDLLPGKYRVEAYTQNWKRGSATGNVTPPESTELIVPIAEPQSLYLKIVDAYTLDPIPNVRLESQGFIQGGLTDQNGLFYSARKFTPDTALSIEINHPSYFSSFFEPTSQENVKTSSKRPDQPLIVKLLPLSGDLTLSGIVIDREGIPI
ncbi:MAG: hypothetical protein KJ645_00300, partial [Planctomycetes bacterium]|nr:hypothetical protein [Planctomycetota bacterium]